MCVFICTQRQINVFALTMSVTVHYEIANGTFVVLLCTFEGQINSGMTSYLKIFATGRTNLKIFPSRGFTVA